MGKYIELKEKFDRIFKMCVDLSIKDNVIHCVRLKLVLNSIAINNPEYLSRILKGHYIHVFRPAELEFDKYLLETTLNETCHYISYEIVSRGVKDKTEGPFFYNFRKKKPKKMKLNSI